MPQQQHAADKHFFAASARGRLTTCGAPSFDGARRACIHWDALYPNSGSATAHSISAAPITAQPKLPSCARYPVSERTQHL